MYLLQNNFQVPIFQKKKERKKERKEKKRKEKEKNDPNFKLFFFSILIGFRDKNEEMLKTTSITINQFLDQFSPFFEKIYGVQNLIRVFFGRSGQEFLNVHHVLLPNLFASSLLVFFIYGFGLGTKKSTILTWYFNLI